MIRKRTVCIREKYSDDGSKRFWREIKVMRENDQKILVIMQEPGDLDKVEVTQFSLFNRLYYGNPNDEIGISFNSVYFANLLPVLPDDFPDISNLNELIQENISQINQLIIDENIEFVIIGYGKTDKLRKKYSSSYSTILSLFETSIFSQFGENVFEIKNNGSLHYPRGTINNYEIRRRQL